MLRVQYDLILEFFYPSVDLNFEVHIIRVFSINVMFPFPDDLGAPVADGSPADVLQGPRGERAQGAAGHHQRDEDQQGPDEEALRIQVRFKALVHLKWAIFCHEWRNLATCSRNFRLLVLF